MPLEVLGVLVGAGVPLAIVLAHLTGGSTHTPLDEDAIRAQLAELDPSATLAELLVCEGGQSALFTLADGRLGVAWPMERSLSLRLLCTWQLKESGQGLEVDLRDPGWPPRRLQVHSPETRQQWLHTLGPA